VRKPSADVLSQIAKGLRVSAEVLYVRAGILEPRERAKCVTHCYRAATHRASEQVLLDIYASFVQQNEPTPRAPTQTEIDA